MIHCRCSGFCYFPLKSVKYVLAGSEMTGTSPWLCRGQILDFGWISFGLVSNSRVYLLILGHSFYSFNVAILGFQWTIQSVYQAPLKWQDLNPKFPSSRQLTAQMCAQLLFSFGFFRFSPHVCCTLSQ